MTIFERPQFELGLGLAGEQIFINLKPITTINMTERVFSGAKHTISDQRNSLKSEIIELLEYLKSCFRLGVFTE